MCNVSKTTRKTKLAVDKTTEFKPTKELRSWSKEVRLFVSWVLHILVNRQDAYGQYLPKENRKPKQNAITQKKMLFPKIIARHCIGQRESDLIGIHAISSQNTSRWVAIDIDHHGDPDDAIRSRNFSASLKLYQQISELGLAPILIDSNGIGGFHILVLMNKPISSELAFQLGRWLIRDWKKLGFKSEPETFPKQPKLSSDCKYGNWLRLPGKHHTRDHISRVWNGEKWCRGRAAMKLLTSRKGVNPQKIPAEASEFMAEEKQSKGGLLLPQDIQKLNIDLGTPLSKIMSKLKNVRPSGDQWSALCPAHSDHNNSLALKKTEDGVVLMYCHAGCDLDDILDELEISASSLYPKSRFRTRRVRKTCNLQKHRRVR